MHDHAMHLLTRHADPPEYDFSVNRLTQRPTGTSGKPLREHRANEVNVCLDD